MTDPIDIRCARIFRGIAGLDNSERYVDLEDRQIADMPFEDFGIDSLAAMEFVMEVETEFGVELDEDAVNSCASVGQVAALVASTLRA